MFLALRRIVIPAVLAAEVVATLVVAERVGLGWTVVWLTAAFVLGVVVIRLAGTRAWATLRGTTSGRTTASDVGYTPLLFLAGLLLAVPGVLSDVVGLVLLTPPGRALAKTWFTRRVGRHVSVVRGSVARVEGTFRPGGAVQAGELVDDGTDDTGRPARPDGPGEQDGDDGAREADGRR